MAGENKESRSETRAVFQHSSMFGPLHFVSVLLYYDEPDWAPSLNLGCESISTHSIEAKSERYERAVVRSRKRAGRSCL